MHLERAGRIVVHLPIRYTPSSKIHPHDKLPSKSRKQKMGEAGTKLTLLYQSTTSSGMPCCRKESNISSNTLGWTDRNLCLLRMTPAPRTSLRPPRDEITRVATEGIFCHKTAMIIKGKSNNRNMLPSMSRCVVEVVNREVGDGTIINTRGLKREWGRGEREM